MKKKHRIQNWLPAALAGVALAGATSVALATDLTYNFNTDVQGWYAADGHGSVVWDETHGRGGAGCLKLTMVAGTDTEIDPRVDVAYNTLGYFSVEFDMMVDPSSGTDASGIFGNLQMVDWDAAWTWHSQWYGSIGTTGGPFSTWKHVRMPFTATYGPRVRLALQIAASAAPYSSDVIIYVDNVVIRDGTPPNKAVLYDFAWPEECAPDNTWGIGPPVWSQDTTLHADGALKEVVDYGSGTTNWQDAPGEFHSPTFDPSKFTYIDFDLYLDAPTGLPNYGGYEVHYWWSWTHIGTAGLSAANIGKWTHYSFPLPASTTEHGIVLHPGGNATMSGVFTYYLDNVTLWKPATPPKITKLQKATGVGGVEITMDTTAQWQRDALVTPSSGIGFANYNWTYNGLVSGYPVSYSFTIAEFPPAVANHGFEAHMYLVNGDTGGGVTGGNATNGGADWNVPDIFEFRVENSAAGGVIAHIDWKTNLPNANPLGDAIYHPVTVNGPTAVGTWTLTFSDATTGKVTGPGGVTADFTLPADAVANNFYPTTDFLQFGMFANDGANDGHNYMAHGTFGGVKVEAGPGPSPTVIFDESFPGPGLVPDPTTSIQWRRTSGSAVQWNSPTFAYWLTWTLPDDNFSVKTSAAVTGPWVDAGVTYTYTQGATKTGAVPAANVPAGPSAYFLLAKPVQ